MKNFSILFFLLIFATNLAYSQDTIRVPTDYTTIQAVIYAATNGDIVLVADGTYIGTGNKSITFSGKEIIVRSENGPQNCVIDCENSDMAIAFVFNT